MKNNRKHTPDILNDLMGGVAIEPVNNKTINQVSNTTILQGVDKFNSFDNYKAIKPESVKAVKTAKLETVKEKTTFNLSQDILIELEDAWIKLRRKIGKSEQRITKTLIVETAIKIALADLESRSEYSEIFVELKN